jgi:hypothetical protein
VAKDSARAATARELLDALRHYRDGAGVTNAQLVKHGEGLLNDSTVGRYLPVRRDAVSPGTWPDWTRFVEPVLLACLKAQKISEQSLEHRRVMDEWIEFYTRLGGVRPQSVAPDQPRLVTMPRPDLRHRIVGRDSALRALRKLLRLGERNATNVPPVTLRGLGGIGKTTLAMVLSDERAVADTLPDGVLWVSLGPKPPIHALLDQWARRLEIDLLGEENNGARSEQLRKDVRDRRYLIVVDDVWEPAHARYFDIGGPWSRTLFTTREINVLSPPSHAYPVDVLEPGAALDLLTDLAPEAVEQDRTAAEDLCRRMEYLPLGIKLAGLDLAMAVVPGRIRRLVQGLIEESERRLALPQEEGRLGLGDGPVPLGAILGMSVDRLSDEDRKRFADLGVFGGEPRTWTIGMVAEFWECSEEEAEDTVSNLARRGLVERQADDRYWMHALLADYADALAGQMP